MGPAKKIRVAFVEDDKPLREDLAATVNQADGFTCVGSYSTAEAAICSVPNTAPDVVVLDINLPGLNGIECLRQLRPLCPQAKFLILTVYEESGRIFQALMVGAGGYLLKSAGPAELLDAIRQVNDGGSPMSRSIARKIVQHFNKLGDGAAGVERLSPREWQVLELLAHGQAVKQIADQLSISLPTVNMYVRQIYAKLHVHSRSEAVMKFKVIQPPGQNMPT